MKAKATKIAIWVSMIAGLATGAILKPVILPSGFSGLHGMGASWDLALAAFGIGFSFIAYALLTRFARMRASHSVAAPKKNIELETNMKRIERKIGEATDKVSEITGRFPKVVN